MKWQRFSSKSGRARVVYCNFNANQDRLALDGDIRRVNGSRKGGLRVVGRPFRNCKFFILLPHDMYHIYKLCTLL